MPVTPSQAHLSRPRLMAVCLLGAIVLCTWFTRVILSSVTPETAAPSRHAGLTQRSGGLRRFEQPNLHGLSMEDVLAHNPFESQLAFLDSSVTTIAHESLSRQAPDWEVTAKQPVPENAPSTHGLLVIQHIILTGKDVRVIINDRSYRTGEALRPGLIIEKIDRDGVTLEMVSSTSDESASQGESFRLEF